MPKSILELDFCKYFWEREWVMVQISPCEFCLPFLERWVETDRFVKVFLQEQASVKKRKYNVINVSVF